MEYNEPDFDPLGNSYETADNSASVSADSTSGNKNPLDWTTVAVSGLGVIGSIFRKPDTVNNNYNEASEGGSKTILYIVVAVVVLAIVGFVYRSKLK